MVSRRRKWTGPVAAVGLFVSLALSVGCDADTDSSSSPSTPILLAATSASGAAGATERARIQEFLDRRYSPHDVQHSFHTKFNETIDCIDFFAQPGAKELAAQGRPVTQLPVVAPPPQSPHMPQALLDVAFNGQPDDEGKPRACPGNTVPMLRVSPEQILGVGGLDSYLEGQRKHAASLPSASGIPLGAPVAGETGNYAHAVTIYNGAKPIAVGQATLSIFGSFVQGGPNATVGKVDHNIGQTWLISSDGLQTVETGWIVAPLVNHLDQTNAHLFVYSTTNGYVNGCFNNDPTILGAPCAGSPFMMTPGAQYMPGMALAESSFNGTYQAIDFYTYFGSTGAGNGWIIFNVGYYPASNFSGTMATGAAHQYYAGYEVYDHSGNWVVPMGSGAASNAAFGQAAYVNNMEAESTGGAWSANFSTLSSDTSSYTVYTGTPGYYFIGDQVKVWWGSNYGVGFSPIGDWASGYLKGQCPNGHPAIGDSCFTNAIQSHALVCGQQTLVSFTGRQTGAGCYPLNITNGDNRVYTDNGWDWQPGYIKDECAAGEYVQGFSQGNNGYIHGLLCCPGNVTHRSCDVQVFYSGNSAAYGAGPDTDPGYNKGICPNGQYVAGVSQNIPDGGVYSLLCCSP